MGIFIVIILVVAGALIARGVRAGLSGSPLSSDDQPLPPANNNLTNWLAFGNMRQSQSSVPTGNLSSGNPSSGDAPAFSGSDSNSGSAPQPDYSDPGGTSYASDPSASGYDPSRGGSDGGGTGGGGGDAF